MTKTTSESEERGFCEEWAWAHVVCPGCAMLRDFYIDGRYIRTTKRFIGQRWNMSAAETQLLQAWINDWKATPEERRRECVRYGSRAGLQAEVPHLDPGDPADDAERPVGTTK